jgi:NAD(P)-dependent dehydrogenase (short-subunit alcohol dehydrogenase family)
MQNQQRPRRLEGAVAIVTGGSQGIGEAISVLFSSEGAKVVILDIKEELGLKVEKEIQSQGGVAKFIKHDVTDQEGWKSVISTVMSTFGKLDILINNAGVGTYLSIEGTSLEDWRKINAINVEGVFLGTQAAVAAMKKNDPVKGAIVNISSVAGLKGMPLTAAYAASKGAVRSLAKAVAAELSGTKIRANSIHPGIIDTPLFRPALDSMPDGESLAKQMVQQGILGESMDVAYACLYLASDEAKFVNGIELIVDGGVTNLQKKGLF